MLGIEGLISDISETDEKQQKQPIATDDVSVNVSVKEKIIDIIAQMPAVTVKELAKTLSVTERTIYRQIEILKTENKIERVGSKKNRVLENQLRRGCAVEKKRH